MKKNQKRTIIIIFVILTVILVVLNIIDKNITSKEENIPEDIANITSKKIDTIVINKLSEMNETERMKYYCTNFFKLIENKKYDEAYEMLNDDFKANFFKEYKDFEEYAKTKLPREIAIEYTNCERLGDMYILWLSINNPLSSSKDKKIEINVVIKENDLDNIEMSFSVI